MPKDLRNGERGVKHGSIEPPPNVIDESQIVDSNPKQKNHLHEIISRNKTKFKLKKLIV